jgi:uncharacterized DUF497 family protein
MRFEWDPRKAAANLRKHGISFEEATTALRDDLALTGRDPDHVRGLLPRTALGGVPYRARWINPHHQRTYSNEIRTENL